MADEPTPNNTQGLLRIAACSIGFYDFVITIPAEIRFYMRLYKRRRINIPLVLFPMCRYFGLITLLWTMIGFYGTGYPPGVCARWMWVGPIFRVLAATSASAVLVWRTWAICGRSKPILMLMTFLWLCVLAVDCYSITGQIPIQDHNTHNCHSTDRPDFHATWAFYVANTVFDCTACILGSYTLWKNAESGKFWLPVTRFLFRHGIFYFILLACLNGVNIGLLVQDQRELKYASTSLAVSFTMILSQRIILSLQEKLIPIRSETESFLVHSERSNELNDTGRPSMSVSPTEQNNNNNFPATGYFAPNNNTRSSLLPLPPALKSSFEKRWRFSISHSPQRSNSSADASTDSPREL